MRALVHGATLAAGPERMRHAVAGLALRGHEVHWHRADSPVAPEREVSSRLEHAYPEPEAREPSAGPDGFRADVVIGGPRAPHRTAWLGWRSGAHCMVLALDAEAVRRWGPVGRWAADSLYTAGMAESSDRDALRSNSGGLALERIGLWPDGPPALEPDAAHDDTEMLERACERAIARHRGRALRPAVFLDRDGTLVVERGYLSDPADIELLPGVARSLRELKAAGYPLVVISNQSGVGRGLFPRSRVHEAMARLRSALRAGGVELDAIYFCPHRPDAGCDCRKPGTALLERAADDLLLALKRSAMVGDKMLDVQTAHRAGALGLLVRTGYGREEEQRGAEDRTVPDAVCENLTQAARWILDRGEAGD